MYLNLDVIITNPVYWKTQQQLLLIRTKANLAPFQLNGNAHQNDKIPLSATALIASVTATNTFKAEINPEKLARCFESTSTEMTLLNPAYLVPLCLSVLFL